MNELIPSSKSINSSSLL